MLMHPLDSLKYKAVPYTCHTSIWRESNLFLSHTLSCNALIRLPWNKLLLNRIPEWGTNTKSQFTQRILSIWLDHRFYDPFTAPA